MFLFCFLLSAFVGDDFFNGAFCAEAGGVVIELFARFCYGRADKVFQRGHVLGFLGVDELQHVLGRCF